MLNPYVTEITPTRPCPVSITVGDAASAALRYEPVCARPAASRPSRVRRNPSVPWSMVWLLAVVHASYPTSVSAGSTCGGTENSG